MNFYRLTILLGISCFSTLVVAEEIKAIPWVKLKVETAQAKNICSRLNLACGEDLTVWKKKNSTENKLYLTDDTP